MPFTHARGLSHFSFSGANSYSRASTLQRLLIFMINGRIRLSNFPLPPPPHRMQSEYAGPEHNANGCLSVNGPAALLIPPKNTENTFYLSTRTMGGQTNLLLCSGRAIHEPLLGHMGCYTCNCNWTIRLSHARTQRVAWRCRRRYRRTIY